MKLLRYECAVGIKLFQWKQYRCECWYFPKYYRIQEHSHPKENIEVFYIFGNAVFYRLSPDRKNMVIWRSNFIPKFLSLPAGFIHWFTVGRWPLIAINFSKFLYDYNPTSAAEDLVLTKI